MERDRGKLSSLVVKATHSTSRDLDPSLLKSIKSIVRSSDSQVHVALETLMENMKKNHSQVRYLSLLIIDELFMRSKLFRSLLVVNLDQFLSLSVGFRRNMPLPPPQPIATTLRLKGIEFLEKWNNLFGFHYRQLRLGFDYLKNTLRFQFPNMRDTAARLHQERKEREIRSQTILVGKFENLRDNYDSIKGEIQSTVDEIGECLDLISSKESNDGFTDLKESGFEEFGSLTLRQIRLDSLKEGEKVHENNDNRVIFDALRELYKLLLSKHWQTVQDFISVLVRVDLEDNRFRDSALKEFIDIRNQVRSVKKRCEDSGCVLPEIADNEDGILWEEGKIEVDGAETSKLSSKSSRDCVNNVAIDERKDEACEKSKESNIQGLELEGDGSGSSSTSLKGKLLAEAPVMTWGSFLDNWGSSRGVLANQRGLELEGHWGRVDYDAIIPAEKIAELNVQATVYKEQQVEIQPCLAPLKKGGLCQRRDMRVCPFHGPIISRDAEGNPISQNPSQNDLDKDDGKKPLDLGETRDENLEKQEHSGQETDVSDGEKHLDLEKKIAEKLAKQAVKNVRSRDKEEAKKRENDKRAAKRVRLAEVRRHNDTVLRKSALASTSQGLGEAIGEDLERRNQSWPEYKEKKQTLASMLRTKATSRNRLSKRLLNAQVTDATLRQLTQGEDVSYREAYPNQW